MHIVKFLISLGAGVGKISGFLFIFNTSISAVVFTVSPRKDLRTNCVLSLLCNYLFMRKAKTNLSQILQSVKHVKPSRCDHE